MFDIGFFELLLIGVVGLLVFGPEQFLEAVRTTSIWLRRARRSFDEVKSEVQREMHNDDVMRNLRKDAKELQQDISGSLDPLRVPLAEAESTLRQTIATPEQESDIEHQPDVESIESPLDSKNAVNEERTSSRD